MNLKIGIRGEDKNKWERRTPLVPKDLEELKEKHDLDFIVEKSPQRAFLEKEYQEIGISQTDSMKDAEIILGVKEIPKDKFEENKVYVFFSHVIKGQEYNMPMLKSLMEKKCTLIDYERIVDSQDRRLIFFGRFAGIAGMIDSLWGLGQRLKAQGIQTPFCEITQAIKYRDLKEAKEAISKVGEKIKNEGLPESLTPLIFAFSGYGHVSQGAQEILDLLPCQEVMPSELKYLEKNHNKNIVYKVVFKEEHLVEPIEGDFDLQDYYKNPDKYRGVFEEKYLHHISVLIHATYWSSEYPRIISKAGYKKLYESDKLRLKFIGDISIDIEGGVELSLKATLPDDPVFIYDSKKDKAISGFNGDGVAILTVDILPTELPIDASIEFSGVLKNFIPEIAKADYSVPFEKLSLPDEIKKAIIVYKGELTADYQYISKYL